MLAQSIGHRSDAGGGVLPIRIRRHNADSVRVLLQYIGKRGLQGAPLAAICLVDKHTASTALHKGGSFVKNRRIGVAASIVYQQDWTLPALGQGIQQCKQAVVRLIGWDHYGN